MEVAEVGNEVFEGIQLFMNEGTQRQWYEWQQNHGYIFPGDCIRESPQWPIYSAVADCPFERKQQIVDFINNFNG